MRTIHTLLLTLLFAIPAIAQTLYFPPDHNQGDWSTLDPADLGYRSDRIQELYDFLSDNQTKSFILLKDGEIVLEQYFGTYTADSLWLWNSAGKSLRATLLGQAAADGLLGLDDPTSDHLGVGWTSLTPEQESAITVWHQMTMTTGLDNTVPDCLEPECFTYLTTPGERWFYDNPPYTITGAVLESATGQTLNAYTNSAIEQPLGMSNGFWFTLPPNIIYLSRARDMARFGLMIQADGRWDTEQVVDSAFVRQMTEPSQSLNPSYGLLWWLNGQESFIPPGFAFSINGSMAPSAPDDLVLAAGKYGQFVGVSRSEGLVMIRQGLLAIEELNPINFHDELWTYIGRLTEAPNSTEDPRLDELTVYPNPADNRVWVSGLSAAGADLRLYSLDGQLLREGQGVHSLVVADLPVGAYVLEVHQDGLRRSFRVLRAE